MSKLFVTLTLVCTFEVIVLVNAIDGEEIALQKIIADEKACKEEVGANDSDFAEIMSKKPASTMEGKCLRSCIMKKSGVMNSNGKFDIDGTIAEAKKFNGGDENEMKIVKGMIDACSGIKVSDDHCEAAEVYEKCMDDYLLANIED